MARRPCESTGRSRACSATCAGGGCLMIRLSCSQPSLVARPFTQSAADVVGQGRDHNQYGFTVWLAGAGLKPGIAHGSTDEIGWKAVDNVVTWPDFHATVLHLLGIDHKRLTYYHNGIQRRLTNVHGEVLKPILA